MKHPNEREQLLADVMADDADLSEAMLSETLRIVRRRRRFAHARRTASVLLVIAVAVVLVKWSVPVPAPSPISPVVAKSYISVRTQPLSPAELVTTQPLDSDKWVVSAADIGIVQTLAGTGIFRVVSDDELLALAAPRRAVIVRLGHDAAELVFVNPPDTDQSAAP